MIVGRGDNARTIAELHEAVTFSIGGNSTGHVVKWDQLIVSRFSWLWYSKEEIMITFFASETMIRGSCSYVTLSYKVACTGLNTCKERGIVEHFCNHCPALTGQWRVI